MRVNRTLMTVGLLGVLQTAVIAQPTGSNLSASGSKAQIQPSYPPVEYKLETSKSKAPATDTIMRVNGSSSQAWTTIATQRQNPSVFHDASTHEPQFCLFSFGHEPWK